MTHVVLRATGEADPDLVWERYADPQRWSTWALQIQRVETSMTRLTTGGTGTVRAGPLPHPTLGVPFRVLAVDEEAHTWSWRVRVGPVSLELAHGVAATTHGSETWLGIEGPGPVVVAYAPVARLALRRLVAGGC